MKKLHVHIEKNGGWCYAEVLNAGGPFHGLSAGGLDLDRALRELRVKGIDEDPTGISLPPSTVAHQVRAHDGDQR